MKKKKHNLKGGCDFNQLVPSERESSVDIKGGLAGKMIRKMVPTRAWNDVSSYK